MVATDGPQVISDGRDTLELDSKVWQLDPSKMCNVYLVRTGMQVLKSIIRH